MLLECLGPILDELVVGVIEHTYERRYLVFEN